jgi:hypothetical protein
VNSKLSDVEKFCQIRGIIKTAVNLTQKDEETAFLVNGSSYLNKDHFSAEVMEQNRQDMH